MRILWCTFLGLVLAVPLTLAGAVFLAIEEQPRVQRNAWSP